MKAIEEMVGENHVYPMQPVCLPFFKVFANVFAKERTKNKEFGKRLISRLSNVWGGRPIATSKDDLAIMETMLGAMKCKVAPDAYENARKRGRWALFQRLTFTEMGESMQKKVVEKRQTLEKLKATREAFFNLIKKPFKK
ncbi:MAG: hypothetical protein GY714_04155, partial [Desulfobacterales bacterium]|nr:hypothetical protein [Desulfobacterales bacterium]